MDQYLVKVHPDQRQDKMHDIRILLIVGHGRPEERRKRCGYDPLAGIDRARTDIFARIATFVTASGLRVGPIRHTGRTAGTMTRIQTGNTCRDLLMVQGKLQGGFCDPMCHTTKDIIEAQHNERSTKYEFFSEALPKQPRYKKYRPDHQIHNEHPVQGDAAIVKG